MKLFGIVALAVGILALAGVSSAQTQQEPKHAPTVAQCQADVKLWYNAQDATEYLNAQTILDTDGVPNRTAYAKLPMREVSARIVELGNCSAVDDAQFDHYHDAQQFFVTVFHDRIYRYVLRHGLMSQIQKEDAEGKR